MLSSHMCFLATVALEFALWKFAQIHKIYWGILIKWFGFMNLLICTAKRIIGIQANAPKRTQDEYFFQKIIIVHINNEDYFRH